MLKSFQQHVQQSFPNLNNSKLLVACSGGLDSMVLAHLCLKLEFSFSLAHCNFSLRGEESDRDAVFVEQWAKEHGIKSFTKTFNTQEYAAKNKMSTQMAARELRYNWFNSLCNSEGYDYILTAHHANDEIETFFINLSRGTGLRGLTGIPHTNNRVLRPLLPFTRVAILAYAKEESIYWREDSSNAKRDYLRNEIRHDLVPVFEKLSPKSFSNFKNTQRNLRASEHLIDDYIVLVTQMVVSETADGFKINVQKLNQLPHTKELLYELLSPYGFTAWNDISDLLDAQSGKQILSNSYRLIKDRECFILSENVLKDDLTYEISLDCENLNDPINLSFKKVSNFEITNANTIFVDADTLNYPLKLRKWEKGDFMYPFGLKGKKKLSKLFKDEKLSLLAKENTWVLLSDDSIVWVVGVRADDRFKVKKSTKRIIKIDYTPK